MKDEIKSPTAEQILNIGARYKGKGKADDEWGISYTKGDDYVRWYSGVGSEVWAMCQRLASNPAACLSIRDVGDGVFMNLDAAECKRPCVIVHGRPADERKASAAKSLGGQP